MPMHDLYHALYADLRTPARVKWDGMFIGDVETLFEARKIRNAELFTDPCWSDGDKYVCSLSLR